MLLSSSGAGAYTMILYFVVIIAVGYFLIVRPQSKEKKRVQAMLNNMEVGDSVVTTSGFYGIIIDITDTDVIVEFGNNKNCRIPMQKGAIQMVEKQNEE